MKRWGIRIFFLVLPIIVIYYYYYYFSTRGGEGFVCYINEATGLLCPGCGGQRAVHALLIGDIKGAFAYNELIFLYLPLLLIFYIILVEGYIVGNINFRERFRLPKWFSYALIVTVITFFIVRNL